MDDSDLVEGIHSEDERADALLLGRRTSEDSRSYWPVTYCAMPRPDRPATPRRAVAGTRRLRIRLLTAT
ncbi:hypothetical protein SAMN05660642_03927 [Geodermatophilus siccatus]|uniref:Uncharacterized protein n=1 Tax=Geodermatophilus siccatus TaxID=1137991 RepID=A0A1G9Y7K9_9ACTN|nr:hypothetical protein [Geodermatophilus siccatus]SDN05162.1 hypothetical protein SAMN05660642_03927 [Geodermatophilus siccatus]